MVGELGDVVAAEPVVASAVVVAIGSVEVVGLVGETGDVEPGEEDGAGVESEAVGALVGDSVEATVIDEAVEESVGSKVV